MRKQLTGTVAALVVAALATMAFAACAPRAADERVQPAPAGAVMTAGNITSILWTANEGEIEAAQLALRKSQDPQVREFAQRMIRDHTAANQKLSMVMDRMNITRQPTTTTQQLMTNTRQTLDTLADLEGETFNRTYLENQIAMHQWLLETLDQTLIPSARNEMLRMMLMDIRGTVANHLALAHQIHSAHRR